VTQSVHVTTQIAFVILLAENPSMLSLPTALEQDFAAVRRCQLDAFAVCAAS
jgi:hypothetical protein